MTSNPEHLIMPSLYEFSVPQTAVSKAGLNLKTQPFESFRQFVDEGAVLGHLRSLENFYFCFPSKQYFPGDSTGVHAFVVPLYDKPVTYMQVPDRDLTVFWDLCLPTLYRNTTIVFNEAANILVPNSQTFGNLHFQILRFPENAQVTDDGFLDTKTREPFGSELQSFLAWHFTRENFSGFLERWNARVDNSRIAKSGGFPSGGIVFTFDGEDTLSGQQLHGFIHDLIHNYRELHDYVFSTVIDRISYLAKKSTNGDFPFLKTLSRKEATEEMERYFFTKEGFPESAKTFFWALHGYYSDTALVHDPVVPYTIAVTRELDKTEVLLSPHVMIPGGTIEVFGNAFKRTVSDGTSLEPSKKRAEALFRELR